MKRRSLARLLGLGLLLLWPGCSRAPGPEETILRFQEAVQAADLDGLFCLSSGAADAPELGADEEERRVRFADWARAQFATYDEGRDAGGVALEDDPIRTVKLLSLGRGTFFEFGPSRRLDDRTLRIPARLRLGYGQLDLSRFSPGTTFYLGGAPLGTVHAVRVPSGPREIRLEVLDRLTIGWTLVRAEAREGCSGGWTVAAVAPVEGSETTTEITWVF